MGFVKYLVEVFVADTICGIRFATQIKAVIEGKAKAKTNATSLSLVSQTVSWSFAQRHIGL